MDQGELLDQRAIGRRIASIRNALGIPPDVAADFASKKRRWIYYLEKGDAILDIKSLNGRAIGFGVSPSVILGLEPIPARLMKRRDFLQTVGAATAAALLSSLPSRQPYSPSAKTELADAFGRSIAGTWNLFHSADTCIVEQIAQSQLVVLSELKPSLQESVSLPLLYSATYRLVGATHHRQGRYTEALQSHERAYRAALESGDVWNMVESRTWQAYAKKALGNHSDSLQTLDTALQLTISWSDPRTLPIRARLLSSAAQDAAFLQDAAEAARRLYESEALLDQLTQTEDEFDRREWLESSGICALFLGQLKLAIMRLQQALGEGPSVGVPRQVITSTALAEAFAKAREREAAIATSTNIVPMLATMGSAELNSYFFGFLQTLLGSFPEDPTCHALVAEAERSLLNHA